VIKFYVIQIKLKKLTLEDVPTKWRKAVKNELDKEK